MLSVWCAVCRAGWLCLPVAAVGALLPVLDEVCAKKDLLRCGTNNDSSSNAAI